METEKKKIMLVEEDPFIIRGYTFFLERAGFEVINVIDGTDVFEAIKETKPDLVLLDMVLPGMHGFEILEILQKKKISKTLPIVVCSNLCQDSDIAKCFSLGATDYIIKSNFSAKEVIERITPFLSPETAIA